MMPILVKSDDVRSERKAKVHHGWLQAAQESIGYLSSYVTGVLHTARINTVEVIKSVPLSE